jgi:sterol desaturase/sphingolipid hydroxylase (fatty acid hydroxylase superfamily)
MPRSRWLASIWYPLFFAVAIAMFSGLRAAGVHLLAALYAPIALVAFSILFLEWWDPARAEWRPRWSDFFNDLGFTAAVQVAVPRALTPVVALAAASLMPAPESSPWPRQWPLWPQVLLMVLLVDLGRYWVHRACHRFEPLWRLHEVHHSPDILYTVNVSRFHPLEKVLHFCVDTVPFVLLGVAPDVLAGYFLLYAVNGYFQHSNLRLSYGFLNYVVGSAETHRWHHARDAKEAQCNFSNTTILWDLVFGTFRLPKDRQVEIGIENRGYPKGFWAQLLIPFRS